MAKWADIPLGTTSARRYFLDHDDDWHWYMVDDAKRAEWAVWKQIDRDDTRAWVIPAYAELIGGSPADITFTNPQ